MASALVKQRLADLELRQRKERSHKRVEAVLAKRKATSRRPARRGSRGFAAAEVSDLFSDFAGTNRSLNDLLVADLRKMRGRSRQLCLDNDYAKRFLAMVRTHIVGRRGIQLVAKPRENGVIDQLDKKYLEASWSRWGKRGVCDVTGRLSFADFQRLFITAVAQDGEALVVLVPGYPNDWGFAAQMLEADHLDEDLNRKLANGNRIVMGVELDSWDRPIAYHLLTDHPGESVYTYNRRQYARVPAERVIHGFIQERPRQVRGIPWAHSAIRGLRMLGGYLEAELVASRLGAGKMGFFTSASGAAYKGDDVNDDGSLVTEVEPGTFEQLPEGTTFQGFDPQHPTTAFQNFTKAILRGVGAGLNVSYPTFANDLEGVNYSSIRSGVLEEREQWRVLQDWMGEALLEPVYQAWLAHSLLTGALNLPPRKIAKFQQVEWQPRGWSWVDPLKDIKASAEAIALGVATRQEIAAQQGKDWRDIVEALAEEEQIAQQLGVEIGGKHAQDPGNQNQPSVA